MMNKKLVHHCTFLSLVALTITACGVSGEDSQQSVTDTTWQGLSGTGGFGSGGAAATGGVVTGPMANAAVTHLTEFGHMDRLFSGTGSFVSSNPLYDEATVVRAGSNGILVAAYVTPNPLDSNRQLIVARLTYSGTIDADFRLGGVTTATFPGVTAVTPIAMTEDTVGNIAVLVAHKAGLGASSGMSVVRFTQTGAVDTRFGTNGILSFVARALDPGGMVSQPDGTLFIAATEDRTMKVLKVRPLGTVDTAFGNQGWRTLMPGDADAIALNSGGIVVAGRTYRGGEGNPPTKFERLAAAARCDLSGVLDTSFGRQGALVIDLFANESRFHGLTTDSEGRLVFVGEIRAGSASRESFLVVRANSRGALDASFGIGGFVFIGDGVALAYATSVRPWDDNILVGGVWGSSARVFSLLNLGGHRDPNFGTSGSVTVGTPNAVLGLDVYDGGPLLAGSVYQ